MYSTIGLWASVITPLVRQHFALRTVLDEIEAKGVETAGRQVGNIIANLRTLGLHGERELVQAIQEYNAWVQEGNEDADATRKLIAQARRKGWVLRFHDALNYVQTEGAERAWDAVRRDYK